MLRARIPVSGFRTTAHLWVVLWKTLDCFIPHGFIYLFSVSSCIRNKTKDLFLPCEASALFPQVYFWISKARLIGDLIIRKGYS